MKYLAYFFIILGLSFYGLGGYQMWLKNDPNRLAFTNYPSAQSPSVDKKDLPIRVTIKTLNIDLPIIPAQMQGTSWTVTEKGASYLLSSPIPGNTGNSIIYAHNWASLFGNLPRVKKGDVVEVEFADKSTRRFIIESTTIVSPTDSGVLASSKDKKITLYTCTGFLDSKRFVAIGVLDDQLAKK